MPKYLSANLDETIQIKQHHPRQQRKKWITGTSASVEVFLQGKDAGPDARHERFHRVSSGVYD